RRGGSPGSPRPQSPGPSCAGYSHASFFLSLARRLRGVEVQNISANFLGRWATREITFPCVEPMRILVTGAAGFIGFHLAKRLLARGDDVVGLDNLNAYYDVRLKEARLDLLKSQKRFEFVRADLADEGAMERTFASGRFDAVVNLAAQAGVRYSL